MTIAPIPENESERLAALESFQILDTLPEQAYDDLVLLAAEICGAPLALMTLVEKDRQWFKSKIGLESSETSRDVSFCSHTILNPSGLFIVSDTSDDERFADNPLVTGDPNIAFYAGAPLVTTKGLALGSLCVIDRVKRQLSERQEEALLALSRQIMAQLELRQSLAERIRRAFKNREWPRRKVTTSVGVASFLPSMQLGDDVVKAADEALYSAKNGGRDRVVVAEKTS